MLVWISAGSRGFNCALYLYSTYVDGCVRLLVVENRSMKNCNKGHVLDHVEKVFEGKNSENNQFPFLITDTYAFIFEINYKVNKLF